MKKLFAILTLIIIGAMFVSCTENSRTKYWGGTMNISIPTGEEFINATWKDSDLWIITRDRNNPNKFYMHESSSFGIMEGTVNITQSPN